MRNLSLWWIPPLVLLPAPAKAEGTVDVLQLAREAVVAVQKGLESGSARGTLRRYNSANKLTTDLSFRAVFDKPKYYVHVTYHRIEPDDGPLYAKAILVHDGSDLFLSRFSDRMHPLGAEGQVLLDQPGAVYNATGGFPCDIRLVLDGMVNLDHLDKYDVEFTKLPNGHYRGRYEIRGDEVYALFEIAPECGYNAVVFEVAGGVPPHHLTRFTTRWERGPHGWYVTASDSEERTHGKLGERREIRVEEFQANVPIPADMFTLAALELPAGARILDHRPKEGSKAYRVPGGPATTEQERADRLIAQVEGMPEMYGAEDRAGRWGRRVWAVVFGVVGLAAIMVVLVDRRCASTGAR